jgi:hypothetical protein
MIHKVNCLKIEKKQGTIVILLKIQFSIPKYKALLKINHLNQCLTQLINQYLWMNQILKQVHIIKILF